MPAVGILRCPRVTPPPPLLFPPPPRGVLTPKEVRDFRKDHPLTLTRGSSAKKKDPLPSDTQPQYKYGRPSEKRLVEEIRRTGVMVPMKSLMEGQYVEEWVRTKEGIDFSKVSVPATIPRPRPTIASTSRARVAHETLGRSGAAPSITSPPVRARGKAADVHAHTMRRAFGSATTPPVCVCVPLRVTSGD